MPGRCLQVTGDENVPAGRVSFMVAATDVMLGSYDGREEVVGGDPDLGGLKMIRPIFASFVPSSLSCDKFRVYAAPVIGAHLCEHLACIDADLRECSAGLGLRRHVLHGRRAAAGQPGSAERGGAIPRGGANEPGPQGLAPAVPASAAGAVRGRCAALLAAVGGRAAVLAPHDGLVQCQPGAPAGPGSLPELVPGPEWLP